jgi:ATP-dependent DNA helicase RecG
LDLSVLDELPQGRRPVKTFVVPSQKREAGFRWVAQKVEAGEQAFVVCPLIEESAAEGLTQVRAAAEEYRKIKERMPKISVGLLHGRMRVGEKTKAMKSFRQGKIGVLVATPVVEVGLDVPRATIMIVEAAERFGLASLHQLRGRVGRGMKESYCFLFTEEKSAAVLSRLRALERIQSGFELAELDLKMRGPGEIYGVKQHGLLEFKFADFADPVLLQSSREAAGRYFEEDPQLSRNALFREAYDSFVRSLVEPN